MGNQKADDPCGHHSKNQTVPGNTNQRLFSLEKGTPLIALEKLTALAQEAPEEFDFEFAEILTYGAVCLCKENEVNISDMLVGKCMWTYNANNIQRELYIFDYVLNNSIKSRNLPSRR
jgi:hypothetical protein